jgi:hypothetical protein
MAESACISQVGTGVKAGNAGNALIRRFRLLCRIDGGDCLTHVGQAQRLDKIGMRAGPDGCQRMARIIVGG